MHLWHNRHKSRNSPELIVGQVGILHDRVDRAVEEGLGRVLEDGGQRPLDQGVGTDDTLAHAQQTFPGAIFINKRNKSLLKIIKYVYFKLLISTFFETRL